VFVVVAVRIMRFAVGHLLYLIPLWVIWYGLARSSRLSERRNLDVLQAVSEAGLTEPVTLHPVIDPALCLGCGACVNACPEGEIIGLIGGKAALLEPTRCIGHGACKASCPHDAISLVFGTQTRGVELPMVGADFQTNVPGLYIAGELGGMGLIRNAIEQGRQAMDSIAARKGPRSSGMLDVIIVGAGPAGFSASLRAKELGLSFLTLEQDTLGGTVSHFPRGKLVMTQPAMLPLVGKVKFREISKEALLAFWENVQATTGLTINFSERVGEVLPLLSGSGFEVITSKETYRARNVLLAIGRRGSPRKLDVPGEDLPKVVYRLIDAAQYTDAHVLVVGGGDSAIEAANSVADEPGTNVTLSYRGAAFSRCNPKNRKDLEVRQLAGRIAVILESKVTAISRSSVHLLKSGRLVELQNDAVIVCAGGVLPSGLLRDIGVDVETKYGTA